MNKNNTFKKKEDKSTHLTTNEEFVQQIRRTLSSKHDCVEYYSKHCKYKSSKLNNLFFKRQDPSTTEHADAEAFPVGYERE